MQASHVIPIVSAKVSSVRTGYETIVPYRAGKKYVIIAEKDGKVVDVTKSTISYTYDGKYGIVDKAPLKEWTTKEEAGACYNHKFVTNLRKGEKIVKGDILAYDKLFFEPDIFDRKRVVYKTSTDVDVVLMEDIQTYEDSCAISRKVSSKLNTSTTKVTSIVVDVTDEIINTVKPGDKVESTTPLLSITDASVMNLTGLDDEAIATLQKIKSNTPKAKVRGNVLKIVVYYNSELDELSDSLRELAVKSDANIVKTTGKKHYNGKVNSSYSINGNPLQPGQVEIKIYIETLAGMGIGDKAIFANQLKTTVGEVFDYTITTEDGTEIEAIFSTNSIAARIVNSPMIIGTTAKTLDVIKNKALDIYFK